jgi:hypothetical protein
VVERRWEQLNSLRVPQAYQEIMALTNGETDGSVVKLEFRQMLQPRSWQQLVLTRDLLPLMPDDE